MKRRCFADVQGTFHCIVLALINSEVDLSRQNLSYPKIVLGQNMAEIFCPMGQKVSAKNNPILPKNVLVNFCLKYVCSDTCDV